MSTNPDLQRVLKGIIHMAEDKNQSQIWEARKKKLKRWTDELTRGRKIENKSNSVKQQNPKLNKTKSEEKSTWDLTGNKTIET
jgi:hypothetical protein